MEAGLLHLECFCTRQDKTFSPQGSRIGVVWVWTLCTNHYTLVRCAIVQNTSTYPNLKRSILIQLVQIKEYILENLALKRTRHKLDKHKLNGKNLSGKMVYELINHRGLRYLVVLVDCRVNGNRYGTWERVEWMVCHCDHKYQSS